MRSKQDPQNQRSIGELESELLSALRRIAELEATNQQLEKAAHEDPLTAIYNRRGFMQRLQAIAAVTSRHTTKISHVKPVFISADLDHFKKINDSYGHPAGDAVLQQFAQILRAHVREYDIVGRFGGEEFVIALTDISLDDAKAKADAIAENVRSYNFQLPGNKTTTLTASFGVSLSLDSADKALYRAKESGRDKVIVLKGV